MKHQNNTAMHKPVIERPFTEDTIYLIQKYHREGMSQKAIAEILGRPVKQVEQLLRIRLAPEEYTKMEEYRVGRKHESITNKPT